MAAESHLNALDALKTVNQRGLFLYATMANTVGSISDEAWKEITESAKKPCGEPNCDCEKLRTTYFDALDALRRDYIMEVKVRRPGRINPLLS